MELQLQHLSKHYGTKTAVNDVSTILTPGIYGLLGANGAGKTTLMRMICGVLKPTSGKICLNGKSIDELGEQYYSHLGYMPQDLTPKSECGSAISYPILQRKKSSFCLHISYLMFPISQIPF